MAVSTLTGNSQRLPLKLDRLARVTECEVGVAQISQRVPQPFPVPVLSGQGDGLFADFDSDPIQVFEKLAAEGSEIAVAPLLYGYVSYATDGFRPNRLAFADMPVLGTDGKPITLGPGDAHVDEDGTVWAGTMQAGRLSIVNFADPGALTREDGSRLAADGQTATPVTAPTIRSGSLEQSNVSVADRLAELTSVSRGFEALQKAMSVLMNDVDGKAIDRLGRT